MFIYHSFSMRDKTVIMADDKSTIVSSKKQAITMTTNDNIIRNRDEMIAEEPPPPPPPLLLASGNILHKFPEFLLLILPYIADRIVWNSIVSSNKKIYKKTKEDVETYLPPWPMNFRLRVPGYSVSNPVWSPDGTQIACITHRPDSKIVIFDQRYGLIRFHRHGDDIHRLEFSPDGSFIVSVGRDKFVRVWNFNTTEGYQLQEWNISQELVEDALCMNIEIDVSPCCRYAVVLFGRKVLLKDVQNNGKTIKSLLIPEMEWGKQIMFSSIDGHRSIFIGSKNRGRDNKTIKIWRPYDDDVDEDDPNTTVSFIAILEQSSDTGFSSAFALSRDNSMLAMYSEEPEDYKIMLYSVDNEKNSTTKRLTLKQSFPARYGTVRFTPDNNYISYKNQDGSLAFWDITTGREVTDIMNITNNNNKHIHAAVDFSPTGSGRRVLVQYYNGRPGNGFYIASYW